MIYIYHIFPRLRFLYWDAFKADCSVTHFFTIIKPAFYFIATVVVDFISRVIEGLDKFACNRSINGY